MAQSGLTDVETSLCSAMWGMQTVSRNTVFSSRTTSLPVYTETTAAEPTEPEILYCEVWLTHLLMCDAPAVDAILQLCCVA